MMASCRLATGENNKVIVCDGCGELADGRHIQQRIERLELATRFRPIHIQVLMLDAGASARPEDYFYRLGADGSPRSPEGRSYFQDLTGGLGWAADEADEPNDREEAALEGFQRRGLFVAYAVECPVQDNLRLAGAVTARIPIMLQRFKASYRPKFVALRAPVGEVIRPLRDLGWGDRLILDGGRPFTRSSGRAGAEFRDRISALLAKSS